MGEDVERYRSAKILVLGDSGVGKSSLIHLICHNHVLNSAQWTIGCSIDVKRFDGNNFLEFWDIGGSRGHKIARSFLYNNYHGVMLVFDATNKKSRSNLDEWLAEVTQKNSESGISHKKVAMIYIGTKKDQLPYSSQLSYNQTRSPSPFDHNYSVVEINRNEYIPPVIYVNTQDKKSIEPGSSESIELDKFYRSILNELINKRMGYRS